jgi:tetratricopeptide (TPR) repeat protein
VISRISAEQYAGTDKTIHQIGEELGVAFVLEGAVRWDRDSAGRGRVRITPKLIRVQDDTHLWSERYDRVLDDIFEVQSDIAEEVVARLGIALSSSERDVIGSRPTENLDAYNLYLRAMRSYTASDVDVVEAAETFERVIELDPQFAEAHGELARIHSWARHTGHPAANMARADRAAAEALRLRPRSPDVQRNLGWYNYWGRRDFEAALEHFYTALRFRPGDSVTYLGLGGVLRGMGRMEEGLEAKLKALELNPRYSEAYKDIADSYLYLRRFDDADRFYRQAIDLAPHVGWYYEWRAWNALLADGNTGRARSIIQSAPTLRPESPEAARLYWEFVLAVFDREWEQALEMLSGQAEVPLGPDWGYMLWHMAGRFPRSFLECYCLSRLDRVEEGRQACERAVSLLEDRLEEDPEKPRVLNALGMTYALLGRSDAALREGRRAAELGPEHYRHPFYMQYEIGLAKIYAWAGDADSALEQLRRLLSIPAPISFELLRLDPAWDPLREDPRFEALLREYG